MLEARSTNLQHQAVSVTRHRALVLVVAEERHAHLLEATVQALDLAAAPRPPAAS